MMAEDPLRLRTGIFAEEQDLGAVAFHADLMGCINRAVDGGPLVFEGGKEYAVEAHCPVEAFADDVKIALGHGSLFLSRS